MKLSIVIPVYNEKNTVLGLIKKVEGADIGDWEKEIIIIDDGSTDGTAEVLSALSDYKIIIHEKNRGKGAALRSGFAQASGEYVIIQDADAEYDPNEYAVLLEPVMKFDADAVMGSRFMGSGAHRVVYFWHYLGNKFLTSLCNMFSNINLTDMETCYKLFRRSLLDDLELRENRFGFEPEFIIKISRVTGIKIFEVGISYNGRTYSEGKKINWKDGFRSVYCIIKYGFFDRLTAGQLSGIAIVGLALINLLAFGVAFGFHPNNDTDSFIWTLERFRGIDSPFHPNRYLNSFYPLMGATFLRFLGPAQAIIFLNIVFYIGLCWLTYKLAASVFKSERVGFLAGLFAITAYPILRYGLTQVQDMGGYFWFLLTVYMSWMWREDSKDWRLWVGGAAVALGLLTKESGAMGALFFAGLLVLSPLAAKRKAASLVKFALLPFFVLAINQFVARAVGYNSAQWFMDNWRIYAAGNYSFHKWFWINISTFNLLWPAILSGLFLLLKNWRKIPNGIRVYFIAILIPSLSYFAWPIFISRTVFISAWLCLPLAAYAFDAVLGTVKTRRASYAVAAAIVICLIFPYVLQGFLKYNHIFDIMSQCKTDLGCVYQSIRSGGGEYY